MKKDNTKNKIQITAEEGGVAEVTVNGEKVGEIGHDGTTVVFTDNGSRTVDAATASDAFLGGTTVVLNKDLTGAFMNGASVAVAEDGSLRASGKDDTVTVKPAAANDAGVSAPVVAVKEVIPLVASPSLPDKKLSRREKRKAAEAAMAEAAKTMLFDIGRTGTVEQFRAANKLAVEKQSKAKHPLFSSSYSTRRVPAQYLGAEEQIELRKGAIQAFHEEHPENIRTVLLYPDEFAMRKGDINSNSSKEYDVRSTILAELIKGNSDPATVINLVVEKMKPAEKQAVLDELLLLSVMYKRFTKPVITALLKAGANANCKTLTGRFKGAALVWAIYLKRDKEIIELLYKNHANFDDAINMMEANDWGKQSINEVKKCRQNLVGDETAAKAMRREIAALKAELLRRPPAAETPATSTPVPKKPAAQQPRPQ